MRNIFLVLSLLCLTLLPASAQEITVDAFIAQYDEVFKMNSATSGTDKVHKKVTVFNEEGLDAASFVVFTDSFRSLGSFSGVVEQAGGKKIKLSKKDISYNSMSIGVADDYAALFLRPIFNYPFTVTYDYTVDYKKGIIVFPAFQPIEREGVGLSSATYSLIVPAGTKISKYERGLDYSMESDGKKDTHKWKASVKPPLAKEHLMKLDPEDLPLMLSLPVEFTYGGTSGSQADWKELGSWVNSLHETVEDLPESEIIKARELVSDAGTEYEKVRRLYSYLKDKTRYVSIQLGIGGYQSLPASHVAKTGFGDCKALSIYMKALLDAVGIDSFYYVIHQDNKDFVGDLCSVAQMNHAMLAVPMKESGDTLFVECTNPSFPLGYRHSSCAGHQIMLMNEEGGHRLRVGSYPDSLRKKIREARIKLREDGSAHMDITDKRSLDYSESLINFDVRKPEDQVKFLIREWFLQPEDVKIGRISNNFEDYPKGGRNFIPKAEVDFSMECPKFANKNGDRLFLPMNPIAKSLYYQRSERINRIYLAAEYTLEDIYLITIPEGFKIESLPDNVSLDSVWGDFSSVAEVDKDDPSVLRISQKFKVKQFDEDKSQYPSYKDFAKKVNKAYSAKIVISRQ